MASAGRPFTPELRHARSWRAASSSPRSRCTRASPRPSAASRRTRSATACPRTTARLVNAVHGWGGRVIAVGTTVVRALETVAAPGRQRGAGRGLDQPGVDARARGVRAVDGLVTGWHEPEASHLELLRAIAGEELLELSYADRARARLPLARVRRQPPDPPVRRAFLECAEQSRRLALAVVQRSAASSGAVAHLGAGLGRRLPSPGCAHAAVLGRARARAVCQDPADLAGAGSAGRAT